jgi:type I restriction enzyme S subunit
MEGKWDEVTVRELVQQGILERPLDGNHGSIHPRGKDFVASGVPFIMASDLVDGRVDTVNCSFITHEQAKTLRKGFAKRGDILLSHKATLGRTAIVGEISGDFVMLTPQVTYYRSKDPARLNNRYLKYYFDSESFQQVLNSWAGGGSTRAYIGITDQLRLPVLLPPIPEQEAIAHILGTLDDKIELNRRMNATLEAMARALFQSWFVDFDPVRAKLDGRQPVGLDPATAALFPEHLEESNFGKKPVGWEFTTLETGLSVLETGGRPKGGVGGITEGIPSIGAESIVSVGRFDFGKTKFVPVEFYEGMRRGRVESRDVLLYKDGGRPGEYEPHVSMFGDGFPFETCCINEHVYRLRANERLSQEYLYFWLTSDLAFAEMRIKGTGVAIPGLNSTAVRSINVLVPPRPVVDAFTRQAQPLVSLILANAKQSHTLATLRDTLLPKLLSGELSVAAG